MTRLLLLLLIAPALLACSDGERAGTEPARELGDGYGGSADAAAPAAPEIPTDAPLVLFLGDSLTAGLHLSVELAWPAALQRALEAEGLPSGSRTPASAATRPPAASRAPTGSCGRNPTSS